MSLNSLDSIVRKQNTCIACGGTKSDATLICWPCHRLQKRDTNANHGSYSDRLETLLNLVDGGHITVAEAVTRYANS